MAVDIAYIYSLDDPISGDVKYIGKTVNPQNRYAGHVSLRERTPKSSWIKSLKKRGFKPVMTIIDEVPKAEWQFWERHYISTYKAWGFRLKNMAEGGLGGSEKGRILSDDHKTKIGAANKGKKHGPHSETRKEQIRQANYRRTYKRGYNLSDEHRAKISAGNKGQKRGPFTEEHKKNISIANSGKLGKESGAAKLISQYDLGGNKLNEFYGCREAERELGISRTNISNCLNGWSKTAGGFKWRYV